MERAHLLPVALVEIAKSAWAVTKLILHPRLPISPTMTKVIAGQKTPVGIATYANSITLTPGTITTGVKGNVSPCMRWCGRARSIWKAEAWTRASASSKEVH